MELVRMRRRSTLGVVTMRIQAVRRVVLRVLQPRDQPFVLVAEVAAHQRWFTHHHHVLRRRKCINSNREDLDQVSFRETLTWDAREKFGPGDLFLLGAGGALFPGPEVLPFRFLRLLAGLCDSARTVHGSGR